MSADEYKTKGNAAFSSKNFQEAIDYFTKAIEASPSPNHVLYSNRSAAYASLHKYNDALNDANECVKINPTWAKGFNRVAAAQYGLGDMDSAKSSYQKALEIEPTNAMAKSGLENVEAAIESRENGDLGFGKLFSDPKMIENLMKNPKTAELMKDPALLAKVAKLQSDPSSMSTEMFSDPRIMTIMGAILGIDLNGIPGAAGSAAAAASSSSETAPSATPASTSKPDVEMKDAPAPAAEPEPVAEEEPVDDSKKQKEAADGFKAEANTLYKQRKFDEAIELYNKAWETYKDITYLNNRAAAEYEKGDYDTAIETCFTAVEEGREIRADYKIVAKSFARIGNCYLKKDDLKKAIEFFEKSLTEHRTPDTLNKLRAAEKELKKRESDAYIDKDKAEVARLEGKDYFTAGDWPNAVKSYTEMIKRDPSDVRGYSNRAAALAKLMSFADAIRDCESAIKLDPKFIRAYIRKANAHIALKEFKQATDTLADARKIESENANNLQQIREIDQLTEKALSARFAPLEGETQEQTLARTTKDPEVVETLQDPVMNSILQQAQNNPAALQEHMKNPEVYKKVMLLMAAGVIRTR